MIITLTPVPTPTPEYVYGVPNLSPITNATGDVAGVLGSVFDLMTSNPLFMFLLGAAAVIVGIVLIKKLNKAVSLD